MKKKKITAGSEKNPIKNRIKMSRKIKRSLYEVQIKYWKEEKIYHIELKDWNQIDFTKMEKLLRNAKKY